MSRDSAKPLGQGHVPLHIAASIRGIQMVLAEQHIQALHAVIDNFAYLMNKCGEENADNVPTVVEARRAMAAIEASKSPSDEA